MRNLIVIIVVLLIVIVIFVVFFWKKPLFTLKTGQNIEPAKNQAEVSPTQLVIEGNDYFPSTTGSLWKYKSDKDKVYLYQISSNEIKESDGKEYFTMETRNNFIKNEKRGLNRLATYEYVKDKNIMYMIKLVNYVGDKTTTTLNPPMVFLKQPFKEGEKWGDEKTGKFEVFKENVNVLGKVIPAYRLDFTFLRPEINKSGTNSMWFVKGIGVVKYKLIFAQNDNYETMELTDYKIMK